MYVQAIVLSIIFTALLAGIQTFVLTNATTWRAHRVDRLMDTQIGAARENFRAALAQSVQDLGPNGPFSFDATTPVAPVCPSPGPNATPCPYQASMEATVVGDTTQSPDPAQPQSASVTANNLQTASFVDEQRVSAVITVSLFAADGKTQVAQRRELVTARTFDASPYAVVTGVVDLAGTAGLSSEADSAGCDPQNASSCSAQPLTTTPADTRIHALQCFVQPDGSCVPAPGSDAFSSEQWQNPNQTTQQGWRD